MKRLFWILFPFIINAANYSDDFNRASLGENWTIITNCSTVVILSSDTLAGTVDNVKNGAYYNAADSTDIQSVSVEVLFAGPQAYFSFAAARIQRNSTSCYVVGLNSGIYDACIGKYINGSFTELDNVTLGSPCLTGDIFTIVTKQDSIIGLLNDVPFDTVIDTDLSGGWGGVIQYNGAAGRMFWDNWEMTDNTGISGCDSVYQIGFTDSVVTQLIYKSTVGCAETDSIRVVYGTDTTDLDTVYHAGSYSAGDTIKDTLKGLSPSTKYFAASLDSLFKTLYDTAWTLDSSEGIPVYFCATPVLDSISDTSVASGTNIRVYGSELKNNNGHFYLDGSEQTIVSLEKDSAEVTISGSLGTYDFYFIDSCNQHSDTIELIIDSIPSSSSVVIRRHFFMGFRNAFIRRR
ncbi:MAG: hypothetical protein JXB48_21120 [Candidatus Latescibacteria bacterium]|nr:hypothetical protein [Candidatus Latescibacterota bacterium]